MAPKSRDFNRLLLNSIDETLLSLGESARQSIYFHIEKNYNITKNEIPADLEHFQVALEEIFGIGARFLEILVMKNLYAKIGHPLNKDQNDQLEFIKYIEAARQDFTQE